MRDQLGNELAIGDAIHVKVGNEWMIANIVKVQNGGIAVTGNAKPNSPVNVTPDALVLQISVGFESQPGQPQHGLFKLLTENLKESIIKSAVM